MIIPYLFDYKTEKGMEEQELEGYVSIGKASELFGVSVVTIRRWTKSKLFNIAWTRTLGKHRRFSLRGIKAFLGIEENDNQEHRIHVAYARVSSHDQKKDLVTQIEILKAKAPENHMMISDIGSGLNYNKTGFKKLMRLILSNQVASITLTHKDRLLRFGSDIVFKICENLKIKVHILYPPEDQSFEQELTMDMIILVTVFAARLYGRRSHKNKNQLKGEKLDLLEV